MPDDPWFPANEEPGLEPGGLAGGPPTGLPPAFCDDDDDEDEPPYRKLSRSSPLVAGGWGGELDGDDEGAGGETVLAPWPDDISMKLALVLLLVGRFGGLPAEEAEGVEEREEGRAAADGDVGVPTVCT